MALRRCLHHPEFHARLCQRVSHPELLDPADTCTDAERYQRLRNAEPPRDSVPNAKRARALIQPMLAALPRGPRRVLDIGCDDGSVLHALAEHWNVNYACGVDTRQTVIHRAAEAFPSLTFTCADATAEESAGLFTDVDTVVLSMVLHHMTEEQRRRLRDRLRAAPQLQWLLIREHDCDSPQWHDFLEVVHGLYAVHEDPMFVDSYNADFQSKAEWIEWGRGIADMVRATNSESKKHGSGGRYGNPTRSFCVVFVKCYATCPATVPS